jgi:hypothetical protein
MNIVLLVVGIILLFISFCMFLYNISFTSVDARVIGYANCTKIGKCNPVYEVVYDKELYKFESKFWVKIMKKMPDYHDIKINRFYPEVQRDRGYEVIVYIFAFLFLLLGILSIIAALHVNRVAPSSNMLFPFFRLKGEDKYV